MKSMAMSSKFASGCSYIIHMILPASIAGTAADGDDDIRLEERHLLGAATCALQGGSGSTS